MPIHLWTRRKSLSFRCNPGSTSSSIKRTNYSTWERQKKLRRRVHSYFNKSHEGKTAALVEKIADVQVISTRTEVEALILENQLIFRHKPPYNIALKNSKRYAWILVTDETFPRIITVRSKRRKGMYFGPFTDGYARRNIILLLNRLFQLRTCRTLPKRVCLQYHIHRCSGPCASHDSEHSYQARIKLAIEILRGNTRKVREKLREQMIQASERHHFEEALRLRDGIQALDMLGQRQAVDRRERFQRHVIAFSDTEDEHVFVLLRMNNGVITKKQEYRIAKEDEPIESFLKALYRTEKIPKEILVPSINDAEKSVLEAYFLQAHDVTCKIIIPQRGGKKKLLDIAQRNADLEAASSNSGLEELRKHLKLPDIPQTIDCFDISTHQGSYTVAACVRYLNGEPDPSQYRKFIIREAIHDDFLSMKEAITRRYRSDPVPDLIVVDGGKGQLSAAIEGLSVRTPIVALAKQHEEVFVPGMSQPIRLPEKNSGLLLLRRIRDATHRQAVGFHRLRKRKGAVKSALDDIAGIGPATAKQLLNHFDSVAAIRDASRRDLEEVVGAHRASLVHAQFRKNLSK